MGSKLIKNNTGMTLGITLFVRSGNDPSSPTVSRVSATLPTGGSQQVDYGSEPFLNGLGMLVDATDSQAESVLTVNQRGSGSTLDSQLNANSTLAIGYNVGSRSFSLAASNS
jgi:hypothetical protein